MMHAKIRQAAEKSYTGFTEGLLFIILLIFRCDKSIRQFYVKVRKLLSHKGGSATDCGFGTREVEGCTEV